MYVFTMPNNTNLNEILKVFLKLGIFGFGGPAAHIAMMREEVVERKKWLTESEFFDLVGATNLIPGPNSTELAIHVGHKMGGWKGLIIAGISFIFPAFLAVLSLAYLYVQYGSLPDLNSILTGIRPAIMVIVLLALIKFRESAIRNWQEAVIAIFALAGAIAGWNEVFLIFAAGLILSVYSNNFTTKLSVGPIDIFLFFLKIGSVLFGSGYVLLAFLQSELVDEKMWLTSSQLLDSVTVGQVTPGPVFTTATFIGYILNGFSGSITATIGIFLPSFFFVAVSAPFLSKLRSSQFFSFFLNGVNAASFALMALVTFQLGIKSIYSPTTILIAAVSFVILKFSKINSAWIILCCGIIGFYLV